MQCNKPITIEHRTPSGQVVGFLQIPCRRCIACKLNRQQDFGSRIYNETLLHEKNSFVTFTIADYCPEKWTTSLQKKEIQKFLKRLRKKLLPEKLRYFLCGEYGDTFGRPHYHAIFFGIDFTQPTDIYLQHFHRYQTYQETYLEAEYYFLDENQEKIQLGNIQSEKINFQRCMYVAKYLVETDNRDYTDVEKPFSLMSRKPGIGFEFYEKNLKNYQNDFQVIQGKKVPLSQYYLEKKYAENPHLREKKRLEKGEKIKKYHEEIQERSQEQNVIYDEYHKHFKIQNQVEKEICDQNEINLLTRRKLK